MDCFRTCFTHVQTRDNVRVQSAILNALVHTLHIQTCDNVRVQSAQWTASECFTHVQTCDNVRVPSATQWIASAHTLHMPKTCHNLRVPNATQWTASVHTLHMSKPVITFVFKVLRNGLLPYMLYTCPNL